MTKGDIIGIHSDIPTLKRIALQVYAEEAAPQIKFRNSGCLKK